MLCDSKRIITRARRLAFVRDAAQLLIVVAVDWMFFRWPLSRVPFVDRDASVLILAIFNMAVVVHVALSRKWPEWNARRIAGTWSPSERKRFATTTALRRGR